MTRKGKYQLMLAGSGVAFVFLLMTEVLPRWEESLALYVAVKESESMEITPDEAAQRRPELESRKRVLLSTLEREKGRFVQSRTSVIEFVAAGSRKHSVRLVSLVPLETRTIGSVSETGLKVSVTASFHQLGMFVGAIESGSVPVQLRSLEIARDQAGSALLQASLEAHAYTIPKPSLR